MTECDANASKLRHWEKSHSQLVAHLLVNNCVPRAVTRLGLGVVVYLPIDFIDAGSGATACHLSN